MNWLIRMTACLCLGLLLNGCTDLWHSNPVDNRSNPEHYRYHDVSKRPTSLDENFARQGRTLSLSDINSVKLGMSTEQVKALLGSPRYQDDSALQWEYDVNLKLPESENNIICQYKVIFDPKNKDVSATNWRRQQCMDLAKTTSPLPAAENQRPASTSLFNHSL